MKKYIFFLALIICWWPKLQAQNTTLGVDSLTIIGTDTLIGPPITFRKYDERFVDFFFFDGNYNVVTFHITENSSCFQFMLSSLDSSTYCFNADPQQFKQLMALVKTFNDELMAQSNHPVKCNYCQTLQMIWYDGDKERSTIKRSYAIPQSFADILDLAYEMSTHKKRCKLELNYFKSLEGFYDHLRGPSSNQ